MTALIGSLTWIRYSGWFILSYHAFIICTGKKNIPGAVIFQNISQPYGNVNCKLSVQQSNPLVQSNQLH